MSIMNHDINSRKIAVLDIDGTLINCQTQMEFLKFLFERGDVDVLYFIKIYLWFALYRLKIISNLKSIYRFGLKYFVDKKTTDVDELIEKFISEKILSRIFHDSFSFISSLKDEGNFILLLSSASEPMVARLSKLFQADDYICTKLEIVNGRYTGNVEGEIVEGDIKTSMLTKYFNLKGFVADSARAYADQKSDISMLKIVGKGYVVNPSSRLMQIALNESLAIIHMQ